MVFNVPLPLNFNLGTRYSFSGQFYPSTVIKYWSAETKSLTDGTWKIDLTSIGLSKVFTVNATANTTVTGVNAPIVTVTAFSPSEVKGVVLQNNTGAIILGGGYAGLKLSNTATTINVFLVGV